MKLIYEKGLIFVDIDIKYKGKKKLIDNVVLDTGAAHTIINPDSVYELGVKAEASDKCYFQYKILNNPLLKCVEDFYMTRNFLIYWLNLIHFI